MVRGFDTPRSFNANTDLPVGAKYCTLVTFKDLITKGTKDVLPEPAGPYNRNCFLVLFFQDASNPVQNQRQTLNRVLSIPPLFNPIKYPTMHCLNILEHRKLMMRNHGERLWIPPHLRTERGIPSLGENHHHSLVFLSRFFKASVFIAFLQFSSAISSCFSCFICCVISDCA